jgi:hypothetical protein
MVHVSDKMLGQACYFGTGIFASLDEETQEYN